MHNSRARPSGGLRFCGKVQSGAWRESKTDGSKCKAKPLKWGADLGLRKQSLVAKVGVCRRHRRDTRGPSGPWVDHEDSPLVGESSDQPCFWKPRYVRQFSTIRFTIPAEASRQGLPPAAWISHKLPWLPPRATPNPAFIAGGS